MRRPPAAARPLPLPLPLAVLLWVEQQASPPALLEGSSSSPYSLPSPALPLNRAGKSKGFGFVNFEAPEQAADAVNALNGAPLGPRLAH